MHVEKTVRKSINFCFSRDPLFPSPSPTVVKREGRGKTDLVYRCFTLHGSV